ncbi:MAG: hypothetical protein JRH20_21165, partial [Deltaproteobacteria bacterium]|nr:hypothetical protein [Deltaproteobacteria bacterium]
MNANDHLFGQIAVALKVLSRDDLQRVVRLQRQRPEAAIGELCQELELLSSAQVQRILKEQQRVLVARRGQRASMQGAAVEAPQQGHPKAVAPKQGEPQSPAVEARPPVAPKRKATTPSSDRHGDLLGRLAVDTGLITMQQLATATRAQGRGSTKRLGELLVEQGYATAEELKQLLDAQRGLREREVERRNTRESPAVAQKPHLVPMAPRRVPSPVAPATPSAPAPSAPAPSAPAPSAPAPSAPAPSAPSGAVNDSPPQASPTPKAPRPAKGSPQLDRFLKAAVD